MPSVTTKQLPGGVLAEIGLRPGDPGVRSPSARWVVVLAATLGRLDKARLEVRE